MNRVLTATRSGVDTRICVGLDVHKDSIVIAIAYSEDDRARPMVEDRGVIHFDVSALDDRLQGLHAEFGVALQVVYEAGPCGFGVCHALFDLGWKVEVTAPTLIPRLPGVG